MSFQLGLGIFKNVRRVSPKSWHYSETTRCTANPNVLKTMTAASHAGAITGRLDHGAVWILLVTSKKDCAQWVFPKGHIDPGETAETAALRELHEEAGVVGHSLGLLGRLTFDTDESELVDYYLVRYLADQGRGEPERQVQWFRFDDAIHRLTFSDARKLLESLQLTIEERLKKNLPE